MLLQVDGFTILTDPTFVHRHESVPIGYGMHTTRLTDPAREIADLPDLDLVLLSHFHGDHVDQVAQEQLPKSVPVGPPTSRPASCASSASTPPWGSPPGTP